MLNSAVLLVAVTIIYVDVCYADVFGQRSKQRKSATFPAPLLPRERKPNIILILTDDQDVELGSLNFMPNTMRELSDKGAHFRNAYVTTPMCCPSRSSLLTGMYVHNHHVYTNNDNCSSTQWQTMYETKSFATYLSNAGYRTGYFGKYLNKYNGSYVPPGWREWGGLIMNSKYYNYSINMNGKKIKHGFDYYKDYYPDLIANDSIAFLRQSKKNSAHKPVMLTMSFPAPHGPEDSAPQYSHLFFNVTTHHTPSYDYAPNPDKQWILKVTQKMQPIHKEFTDLLMTKRLQTLQSVDAAVKLVVEELKALDELDNTYIFYTSDHGYHLGQFGLIKGKSFPFEFDVRIPFLIKGPGVEPGTTVEDIVLNIDLAPTFLDIAGVEVPPHMDGRSVLPLIVNNKRKRIKWPDTFLIESSGRRETPFLDAKNKIKRNSTEEINVSTLAPIDYSMATSTKPLPSSPTTIVANTQKKIYESGEDLTLDDDDEEEFDDVDDDDELDSIFEEEQFNNDTNRNSITNEDRLMETKVTNKVERLNVECTMEEMQFPCKFNQKWYCRNDTGRWRKHKCKFEIQPTNKFKKCACFTQNGLIYKKIPVRNITRRHIRDPDLNHILFKRINPSGMNSRAKRDTLDHVETVMKDVQGQLFNLKTTNTSLETNSISHTAADCIVLENGQINCSTNIYHDRKRWRQSRHRIDNEIHQLKQKLEKLKEIRRHLKHTKPITEPVLKNLTRLNRIDDWEEEASEETTTLVNNKINKLKKKRKRIHEIEESRSGNKRVKITVEMPNLNGSKLEVTTTGPPSHNQHRHNHRYTTKGYDDEQVMGPEFTSTVATTTTTTASTSTIKPVSKLDGYCQCEIVSPPPKTIYDREKELKRRLKEEKLRRKLRKQRKKDQLEKECGSERMNCFHHDNDHWKTAPLWTSGPFCFCMNANNNTYSCVRTINSTHNFLYCEFTTGLITFYNLRKDPFELRNIVNQLKIEEKRFLHDQLMHLMSCKGKSCTVSHHRNELHQHINTRTRGNMLPINTNRYKKRKYLDDFPNGRGVPVVHNGLTGARINMKRNTTAYMEILRQAGIRRKRRKIA